MAGRELPKTLTREEVDALMARPNTDCPTGLRNRAMLALMHRAGLRVSEVCGLHVRDVDWREGRLHLRAEITKGGREAWLPLDPPTLEWLVRWKAERRRHAAGRPHLFTTLKGGPLGRKYVWEMVSRYARRAGVKHTHPHMLRHTFASELLAEGTFNLREVQELCRHADVRTTQIYTPVQDAELARKVRART